MSTGYTGSVYRYSGLQLRLILPVPLVLPVPVVLSTTTEYGYRTAQLRNFLYHFTAGDFF